MGRETAISATKQGAIAACISGGMTTLIYLIASLTQASSGSTLAFYNDPSIIFDIVIIFALAWFIYKKSRVAAVLMFLYFLFAKIYMAVAEEQFSGLLLGAVFLFFYGRAVWGAFTFHKIERLENPNYKRSKKWVWFVVTPILVIVIGLITLGTMTMTGFMPSTEVQSVKDVNQRHIDKLIESGLISNRDDMEYFYSGGFMSVMEEGVFVSNENLTMYYTDPTDTLQAYELPLDQITQVKLIKEGSFVDDAHYRASTDEPDAWIEFYLSVENDGHLKFIDSLKTNSAIESKN